MPAIQAKFTQNEHLATYLLNTGTRDIGEATQDLFWGVGMNLKNKDIMNQNLWKGKSVMGKVLMQIRAQLVVSS